MRLSLDYDNTFTRDPAMWTRFVEDAVKRGHDVVCVTMRRPEEAIEMPCPVIYTSRAAKQPFCVEHGHQIDVWIDDAPNWLLNDG
jgi:hypothetical protein